MAGLVAWRCPTQILYSILQGTHTIAPAAGTSCSVSYKRLAVAYTKAALTTHERQHGTLCLPTSDPSPAAAPAACAHNMLLHLPGSCAAEAVAR
jgi:hypothetical protein